MEQTTMEQPAPAAERYTGHEWYTTGKQWSALSASDPPNVLELRCAGCGAYTTTEKVEGERGTCCPHPTGRQGL